MKPTDLTLNEQLRITTRELSKRKKAFNISEKSIQTLLEAKPIIFAELDDIVNDFYKELLNVDGVPEIIGDAESLHRLGNHVKFYIRTLLGGTYDMDYIQSRLRIGMVHKRIGVSPKLYFAAYKIFNKLIRTRLLTLGNTSSCESCLDRTDALENIILFDLALVSDTFILGLVNELNRSKEELEEYAHELEKTVAIRTKQLAEQASKDGLTGLYNQRTFFDHLELEISRSHRRGDTFSICYFDLDNFKKANDTHGHKYGDEILINVATAMKQVLRKEDIAARYGGDEFCILFPDTQSGECRTICERLIEDFSKINSMNIVTMSIGLAEFSPETGLDADTLIKMADKAMYSSKKKPGHYITQYSDVVITSPDDEYDPTA
ncbi:GGDEF domain-containing protein [Halodesulfovibrio aestuarii]|uniref:Diguanylate cyclase DosC n=1 Tax=Halodesulfovibrio aestuarii TaxID=126333 RepID=A0A8G2C9N5_9BACT|nr:GGDEF domain-containing protein [Halodesulfovibrio aestuarii]SHJ12785.1 diguanylate cyclase (GGDEF) domain-containing protein [Halodesulfovibrio aestuarii]